MMYVVVEELIPRRTWASTPTRHHGRDGGLSHHDDSWTSRWDDRRHDRASAPSGAGARFAYGRRGAIERGRPMRGGFCRGVILAALFFAGGAAQGDQVEAILSGMSLEQRWARCFWSTAR